MKFILTRELGKLAKWLRILGFDAEYYGKDNFSSLFIEALRQERIILTRNQHLPASRGIKIIQIKSERLKEQIQEIIGSLGLKLEEELMFSRCTLCNRELDKIEKDKVKDKVPEYVYQTQEKFFTCMKCRRIYWSGTHWGNVVNTLKGITQ